MHVSVPHVYPMIKEIRRGHQIPWTGVTGICELLCGSWDSDPSLQQELQVFLTAERSIQSMLLTSEKGSLIYLGVLFALFSYIYEKLKLNNGMYTEVHSIKKFP